MLFTDIIKTEKRLGNETCNNYRNSRIKKMKVCRWCKEEVPDDTDGACPNCKSTEGYMG